jgi:hypothetical protein
LFLVEEDGSFIRREINIECSRGEFQIDENERVLMRVVRAVDFIECSSHLSR